MRLPMLALALALASTAAQAAPIGAQLDASIHPDEMRGWLKLMAAEPNQVGSPHDKANAEYELAQFKTWGWDAHIETFEVLYPDADQRGARAARPRRRSRRRCTEPRDPGRRQLDRAPPDALPAYVAYQGDGDVTAPLVYVNYGMPDDYEALERHGRRRQGQDRHRPLRRAAGAG